VHAFCEGHEAMEESRAGKTSQITLVKEDTNHKRSNSNKVKPVSIYPGPVFTERALIKPG